MRAWRAPGAGVVCVLVPSLAFLLPGCLWPPPVDAPAVIDPALIGTWYAEATHEGLAFADTGAVTYLDVAPDGTLRVIPGNNYRGMTQTVTSAADNILTLQAKTRLRLMLGEQRTVDMAGEHETRDEYLISTDGNTMTILTAQYGRGDGIARDLTFRRATLGERVADPHDITFAVAGAPYTADSQVATVSAGELEVYGEYSPLNTIQITAPATVGRHALTGGGAAHVEVLLVVGSATAAPFDAFEGEVEVTELTDDVIAGTVTGSVHNRGDRTDVRTLEASFRINRD